MSESVVSQPGNVNYSRSITRIRSEEDLIQTPILASGRMSGKGAKTYQIDQDALNRYKRILQKRVAWAFVLLFAVIVERIFSGYTRLAEDNLISSLQSSMNIAYDHSTWYLQPIIFLEQYLSFTLLMTHYFVIIYYYYSAILCLKIMYVHFNAIALISIIEMIFSDPRPYWNDDQITGAGCENSYGFPSFTVFCFLFLFMYSWHCFQEDEHDERSWDKMDFLKSGVFGIVFLSYCFLKVAGGFEYISQMVLTSLYSILFYYLAIFFDKTVTTLVEKSSIDVQSAKRYIIYWLVYLLMFAGLATVIFENSETVLNIDWFGNYFNCLERYKQTEVLKETPYYHLLGSWGSYLKTMVLFVLLGTVFGSSKAFRDFKGVLWFASSKKNKAIMAAVASLMVLPSWIIVYFQAQFIDVLQAGGIDTYLFNALHFTVLYFVLFGVLPKYVFDRWGLLNKEALHYFGMDDFASFRMEGSVLQGGSIIQGSVLHRSGSGVQSGSVLQP